MASQEDYQIMHLHIQTLKCLFLWPIKALTATQNAVLIYGFFGFCLLCSIPVISAVVYQLYVGIQQLNILLEAFIGVCDIIGHTGVYICLLKNREKIENIFKDVNQFARYSGLEVIRKTDIASMRYTKFLLLYVTIGVSFNLSWPMMSIKSCNKARGSDFYVKYDPCGLPTQNLYPFEASYGTKFWLVFIAELIYCCHICYLFSLATAIVVGLLMHLTAQLKCCRDSFERMFDEAEENEISQNGIRKTFNRLVKYHQAILSYSKKVFRIFESMVIVYFCVTSFSLAIIGYQIASPKTNVQDKLRYSMLLFGWSALFFLICFYAHKVQYESLMVGDSLYNSQWHRNGIGLELNKNMTIVIARCQKPLAFKVHYFGTVSLVRFVSVIKTAYSVFTLLVTMDPGE